MTRARQLRLTAKVHNHCKQHQIPADLIPLVSHSFLSWLDRYPNITRSHLDHCLEAFVQGWIKGSLDIRIDQELTNRLTSQN